MKTAAFIMARMGSTRVPGKVLRKINEYPMLEWCVRAVRQCQTVDEIWIATTVDPRDDEIIALAGRLHVPYFRGAWNPDGDNDVLDRYYQCNQHARADVVLRITGDCPFIDPRV